MLSLGVEVNVLPAAIEAVRVRGGLVVAEVSENVPHTFGDAEISTDLVDYAVHTDTTPLPHVAPVDDDVSSVIGERVSSLVPDGATLQLGIGAVPDAASRGLRGRRHLRIWSELASDGVRLLEQAGALSPDHPVTASFCLGSVDFYAWLHENPRIRLLRTERTNEPAAIASQPGMVSVNSALEVDLFGQANACRIRHRIYSGIGGQTDFVSGALHARGGRALIALPSWHQKADCSTIVPILHEPATSAQHTAVVTEQGVAEIWGSSEHEQARHLIQKAAHPDARDGLWREAHRLGLA